jgi:O-acetyl-ADP-ribose deacetylase (regulator of RNase III)
MLNINYKIGNIVNETFSVPSILLHCCNDVPVMGGGVARAIANKWPHVESEYMEWDNQGYKESGDTYYLSHSRLRLGEIQLVDTIATVGQPELLVCNMIGQRDCGPDINGNPPVRYEAFEEAFGKLRRVMKKHFRKYHIQTVKLGAGLAGGDWSKIEEMLDYHFIAHKIPVTVYDLAPDSMEMLALQGKIKKRFAA